VSDRLRAAVLSCVLAASLFASAPAQAAPTPNPTAPGASAPDAAGAPGPSTDDGDRAWSVRPAGTDGRPDTRTHYTLQGSPGDVLNDQVLVTNESKVDASFDIYGTDAFNTPTGAFDLLPAAKKPTDIGAWVTFPAQKVTIAAGHSVVVAFRVTIPRDATPGDHAGGVVVSLATGSDVRLDTRVAVRLYLRVPGFLRPELTVQYVRPTYSGVANPFGTGGVSLTYTVVNTGNIRLSSHPKVKVTSALFGSTLAQTTPEDLPELLPGGKVTFAAHLAGVFPAGPLTVTVELQPFPDPTQPVGQEIPTFSGHATIWAVPWLLLVLVLVVGGLAAGAVWFLRTRRRGNGGPAVKTSKDEKQAKTEKKLPDAKSTKELAGAVADAGGTE
jgi:hypothetical protein